MHDIYKNRHIRELEDRTEPDERLSQHSSSSKRNSSDTLKEKLRDKDPYSITEAIAILEKSGKGLDISAAQKLAKSARITVEGMHIVLPKTTSSGQFASAPDNPFGQALTDHVQNMICQGGEALVAIVKTNLDIDDFVDGIRQIIQGIDDDIHKLEESKVEVDEPNKEVMELQLKLTISAGKQQLYDDHRKKLAKRMKRRQRQVRERIAAVFQATRAQGSGSGGEAPDDEGEQIGGDVEAHLEDWEGSPEQQEYLNALTEFIEAATENMEREYVEEFNRARSAKKLRSETTVSISKRRAEIVKLQVVELLATELKNLKTIIIQKIKSAVGDHLTLRTRLNQNVLVCGEAIEQPYDYNNLSGMYQILLNAYSQATISFMCDYLLELLSLAVTVDEAERNPEAMVTKVAPMIKQFTDMRLSSHLTQDMLFVVSLLKGYPQATRQDILRVLYVELQARENDPHRAIRAEAYPGMPMYSIVVNYISEILVKSKQFVGGKSEKPKEHWRPKPKDSLLESAAYGSEGTSGAGQGGGFTKTVRDRKYVSGTYRSEVPRTQSLWVREGRREFPYTATTQVCPNCPHEPRCWMSQCTKCMMYGHKDTQCRQQPPRGGGAGGHSS